MNEISLIAPELRRLERVPADLLCLYRFSELDPLQGICSLVDWRLLGHLSRLLVERFWTGERGEALLMPLGKRLPQTALLVVGLGKEAHFGEAVYKQALKEVFQRAQPLGADHLALALPGRVEKAIDTTRAIDWFLDEIDSLEASFHLDLLEPLDAQKAIMPMIEKWRLRHLMP